MANGVKITNVSNPFSILTRAIVAPQFHSFDVVKIVEGVIFNDFDFVGVKTQIFKRGQSVKRVRLDVLHRVVPKMTKIQILTFSPCASKERRCCLLCQFGTCVPPRRL